jgi:phage terminase large subunit-like protein
MITNVDVYFAIAEEALAESERLEKLARRPKPDGEPGVIVTYDPERKSFKNSLVAIVFAGMYLDALFYILAQNNLEKHSITKNTTTNRWKKNFTYLGYLIKTCWQKLNDSGKDEES